MSVEVLRLVEGKEARDIYGHIKEFVVFTDSGVLRLTTATGKYIYYGPGMWVRVMEA